jgi:hypothetical protein
LWTGEISFCFAWDVLIDGVSLKRSPVKDGAGFLVSALLEENPEVFSVMGALTNRQPRFAWEVPMMTVIESSVVHPPTEMELAHLNSLAGWLVNQNASVAFDYKSGYWLVGLSRCWPIGLSYVQALYELTDMK